MKSTMKMMKAGLIALFLSTTSVAFGQTDVEGNINKPPIPVPLGSSTLAADPGRSAALVTRDGLDLSEESQDVVLFYNPATSGPSLKLVASKTEDHALRTDAAALAFTKYVWSYMGKDPADPTATAYGSVIPVAGLEQVVGTDPDAHTVDIAQLSEGYHIFKVEGYIIPEGADPDEICPPVHEEFFVIYVLPELAVTATGSLTTGESFQYCETEANPTTPASGQAKVQVSTGYDFVRPNTPDASEFDVKYRWYSVKRNTDGTTYPDVSNKVTDPSSITGVTELEISATDATGGVIPNFFPQIDEFGTYKVFVEIEYAIKDRNYKSVDESAGRVRPHVIYRGFAQVNSSDMILTVTPAPGKPHITIESVID